MIKNKTAFAILLTALLSISIAGITKINVAAFNVADQPWSYETTGYVTATL